MKQANPARVTPPRSDPRTRRVLVLLAVIAIAPMVLAYAAYYLWPRDVRTNYGVLLPAHKLAPITGVGLDGSAFDTGALRGRWLVLYAAPGACDAECAGALYASRQARTIQNAERERVQRAWLVTDDATPAPALIADHPDLSIARVAPGAVAELPGGTSEIYLVDPLGNFVLAWPADPDIKAMANDLRRVLRASGIG